MKLKIQSIEDGGVIRVAVEGAITGSTLPRDGSHPLCAVAGEAWSRHRIALSLDETTYLDSIAIGWLLTTVRAFKAAGGSVVLHSVPPAIRQLFEMLKLTAALPLADDDGDAMARLRAA